MKYVDEFRNAAHVRALATGIARAAERLGRRVRFMEVCGGHTMAIHRFGIPGLLPESVELLSGPGCPVCVTPTTFIDRALEVAKDQDAILTTFGDLYRVPGAGGSLEDAAAHGADVRVVYSPSDALPVAAQNASRRVVFLGIGFETTAPTVAAVLLEAQARGRRNLAVLSGHKTMPRALRALLEAPEVALDGLILPGHVSTIIGEEPYRFIPEEFGVPCCITGFEPSDILRSILVLVEQCVQGPPRVANSYERVVRPKGNPKAWELVRRVFRPADAQWRGIGMIEHSGLDLRDEWEAHRVEPPDPAVPSEDHAACRCGDVLRGLIKPPQCPLFGVRCTPETPVGPCMVSSEGSCAAHHKYAGA